MPVEGRGVSSRQTQQAARDRGLGNLATPKRVQKLQMALHAKAKAEAGYRFYALYDKLSREDILAHAYAQCRSNKGAPGRSGGCIRREPEKPTSASGHRRRASGTWWKPSTR